MAGLLQEWPVGVTIVNAPASDFSGVGPPVVTRPSRSEGVVGVSENPQSSETTLMEQAPGDAVASFRQNGYVILRGFLPQETRETMLRVTQQQMQEGLEPLELEAELQYPGAPESLNDVGGRTIRRLKQAHGRHPVFTEWIASRPIVQILQQLLGGRVVMPLAHHNCIMTKMPNHSSDTGWHQDIRYWSFERPELISLWAALGHEYPENGGLKLIPGTHLGPMSRDRLDDELFLRTDLPANIELIDRQIDAVLEPGDVLLFHSLTFHAASRNHSHQPKFSAVFTFRNADNPPRFGTRSSASPELLLPEFA